MPPLYKIGSGDAQRAWKDTWDAVDKFGAVEVTMKTFPPVPDERPWTRGYMVSVLEAQRIGLVLPADVTPPGASGSFRTRAEKEAEAIAKAAADRKAREEEEKRELRAHIQKAEELQRAKVEEEKQLETPSAEELAAAPIVPAPVPAPPASLETAPEEGPCIDGCGEVTGTRQRGKNGEFHFITPEHYEAILAKRREQSPPSG